MLSFICPGINAWVKNREAGDLRRPLWRHCNHGNAVVDVVCVCVCNWNTRSAPIFPRSFFVTIIWIREKYALIHIHCNVPPCNLFMCDLSDVYFVVAECAFEWSVFRLRFTKVIFVFRCEYEVGSLAPWPRCQHGRVSDFWLTGEQDVNVFMLTLKQLGIFLFSKCALIYWYCSL